MKIQGLKNFFFYSKEEKKIEENKNKSSEIKQTHNQDFLPSISKIESLLQKNSLENHRLDPLRTITVLSGEKTGRLETMRTEVLKEVIQEENKLALANSAVINKIKNTQLF